MLSFGGLILGVLPAITLSQTGGPPAGILRLTGWPAGFGAQLIALAALPGVTAVQEFCRAGRGTPLPYDPPKRLVTTGIYAYVANPMQLSLVLVFGSLSLALQNPLFAAGALVAFAYGAGLAGWHEDAALAKRFGEAWTSYRAGVPRWWPRWRPWAIRAARLYLAESCGVCSSVGRWLARRHPDRLDILPAEEHPSRHLSRITYESLEGHFTEQGTAAFARALEHIHLGWAVVGWTARLPLVRPIVQIVMDASGGEPRAIPRRSAKPI